MSPIPPKGARVRCGHDGVCGLAPGHGGAHEDIHAPPRQITPERPPLERHLSRWERVNPGLAPSPRALCNLLRYAIHLERCIAEWERRWDALTDVPATEAAAAVAVHAGSGDMRVGSIRKMIREAMRAAVLRDEIETLKKERARLKAAVRRAGGPREAGG